ncbi:MAG: serine protease [Anaerolineales bacterium]|nr:serine protease [Anaerolineales bacterium]
MKDANNTQGLSALSQSLVEATQAASASIVTVHGRRRLPSTGVIVEPGLVLTASHTLREEGDIQVSLADGTTLGAELLGRDPHSDLAVLKLVDALGTPARINEQPQVGQLAIALGRPGQAIEASLGVVSAIGGPVRTHGGGVVESTLRTDATAYPGFSGGPLVDDQGQVLGINTSGLGWGSLMSIPAKQAWKIAKSIQEHGGVQRGYLGVRSQLAELPADAKQGQATGLLIASIEAESPAAAAGLMVGDIIVGLAGQAVADHDALMLQLNSGIAGTSTALEYLRGGALHTAQVSVTGRTEAAHHHRHGGGRRGRGFGGHGFGHRPMGRMSLRFGHGGWGAGRLQRKRWGGR